MATCRACTNHNTCEQLGKLMLTVDNDMELVYQHYVEKSCPGILLATNNGVRLKNSTIPQPKSYLEELDDALDDLKTRMF